MFISTFTADKMVHKILLSHARLTRALTSTIIYFVLNCHKLEQHSQTVTRGGPGRRRKLTWVPRDISHFRGKHITLVIKLFGPNYLINGRVKYVFYPMYTGQILPRY